MGGRDPLGYYKLLGIPTNASEATIKKKYRELALKHHPDKNPDNREESEEKFKKILQAYHILSDPAKRQEYDLGNVGGSYGEHPGADWFQFTTQDMDNLMRQFDFEFFDAPLIRHGSTRRSTGSMFDLFFEDDFPSFFSSSATSSGNFTSTRTTTTIINGKVITRTETTSMGPDGTVTRHVVQGNNRDNRTQPRLRRYK
ncbi:bifunctional DnaJ domain/Chaperone J-domain superfamily [Babesia duncani]|uniref:Bifunctional DnaJ domain/Chaperone J-domain superfamily n=1 Tax=Babesia duncani TaxID=323732 RepID=A0AAD9PIX1_9APIC|nr:bifunctional DnaJ domain/Chaperone J-domain superfamily [Babesia duncani]